MPPSKIPSLSSSIDSNTRKVVSYFTANDLPTPSFQASTPPDLQLPPHIMQAKEAALEAMDELHALLLGPVRLCGLRRLEGRQLQVVEVEWR